MPHALHHGTYHASHLALIWLRAAVQARTPLVALMDVDMLVSAKLVTWLERADHAAVMVKVGSGLPSLHETFACVVDLREFECTLWGIVWVRRMGFHV